MNFLREHIMQLHRQAIEKGESHYVDPETGHDVATEAYLIKRGWCCGLWCRHCPYGEEKRGTTERIHKRTDDK